MEDHDPSTKRMPTWGQGLLLGGAGAILAVGGCATFLSLGEGLLSGLGAIVFVAGAIAVPIGGVMFLVGLIKELFAKSNEPQ